MEQGGKARFEQTDIAVTLNYTATIVYPIHVRGLAKQSKNILYTQANSSTIESTTSPE